MGTEVKHPTRALSGARRQFLGGAAYSMTAAFALPLTFDSAHAQTFRVPATPDSAARIVVTLLGTGSPDPNPLRFSAATLVQAGGMNFLFDAGRGASIRLNQLKVPLGSLSAVLLTHFHSDHVVGLPDVWLMGFINPNFGGRTGALLVIGPEGTKNLVDGIAEAYRDDVRIRITDQKVDPAATAIRASEFGADGTVSTPMASRLRRSRSTMVNW